jgi:hypothetical protein
LPFRDPVNNAIAAAFTSQPPHCWSEDAVNHIPREAFCTVQRGDAVKRFYLSSKVAGFLLLNLLLWANVARGQLSINPSTVNFGSVKTGSVSSQAVVLSNSGKSTLTVSLGALTGQGFRLSGVGLPLTLSAGTSATLNLVFAPASGGTATGALSLVTSALSVHDRSGKHNTASTGATSVALSGIAVSLPAPNVVAPGSLVANPGRVSFTNIQVGSSQTQTASLTNSGGSDVTIAQASTSGNGFDVNGLSLPLTLSAGQSVTFGVTFAPLSAGSAIGGILITSDASNASLAIPLSGAGTAQGQLTVTPASADFGTVILGSRKTQTATLSASGSSITLSSASMTGAEFLLSGVAFPLTLSAGQSVPFTLTFAPQVSGATSATLSFVSNAANALRETLTGTGATPPQHTVSLSWDAASGVVGYNVYRGIQSGGPYSVVNSVVDAGTNYADSSVQGGQIYYYVTTSVDSTGAQSPYSNETQAVIPAP